MDKIYPLLPWLTLDQAIDWLRRLTNSTLTGTDLISLCDADQCGVHIDVGHAITGTDEETWSVSVVGSGYQRVISPKSLKTDASMPRVSLVLYGKAFWMDEGGAARAGEIHWFSDFATSDVFPIFKSPNIKALAEKINAEELASTEQELEQLRRNAEQGRRTVEAALLRAQDAEFEIGELRQRVILAEEKADIYRGIAKDIRGSEDELIRQIEQERSTRAILEAEVIEFRKSTQETNSDSVSKRERATYDRLIYILAREAGYRLEQPYADEGLIRAHAETLGAKVPTGKGSIAKRLAAALARSVQDEKEFSTLTEHSERAY